MVVFQSKWNLIRTQGTIILILWTPKKDIPHVGKPSCSRPRVESNRGVIWSREPVSKFKGHSMTWPPKTYHAVRDVGP